MAGYEKILDDLEQQVEKTETEFEEVKSEDPTDKEKRAKELIQEIEGQIEFLEEQMKKQ